MRLDRRTLIAAAPLFLATPALAAAPIPELTDYERVSGGRIGVFGRNLKSGAALAWRAELG